MVGKRHIAVEYSPARGFGLHTRENDGYGERPDEILQSYDEAWGRLQSVISAIRLAAGAPATEQSPRSPP
jgi:hypothetical protein